MSIMVFGFCTAKFLASSSIIAVARGGDIQEMIAFSDAMDNMRVHVSLVQVELSGGIWPTLWL
jgi:hypothetical protein